MNLKFGMAKDLDVQLVLTGNMEFDKQLSIRMADRLHSYLMDYYRSTVSAIKGQKEVLIKLADLLYEKEVLTEEEIKVFTAENIQLKNEP